VSSTIWTAKPPLCIKVIREVQQRRFNADKLDSISGSDCPCIHIANIMHHARHV
jgi:hypothetical protein